MSGVWSGMTGTELQISCSDPSTRSRQRVRISPSVPITPVTLRCQRSNAIHNRIIFDELVFSSITREAQAHFVRIIETFKSAHQCDAVVLGCTEIPLVVTPEASPLPTLDSTRLLARAALKMGCQ